MGTDMNKNIAGIDRDTFVRWGVLAAITVIFTTILYPSLVIKQHSYQLGDVAERNIKAPKDFFVEDKTATEERRQQAANAVLTVYDHDKLLTAKLTQSVTQAFVLLRSLYTSTDSVDQPAEAATAEPIASTSPSADQQALMLKPEFEKLIGIPVSDEEYGLLIREKFDAALSAPMLHILKEVQSNGVVANKELLLKEQDRGITLRSLQNKTEQTVYTLRSFYGLDQAKTMVRIIGDPLLKEHGYQQRNVVVSLVQKLIFPNITLNRSETEERKRRAEADIKPILYQIKSGEMILREGERVTPMHLKKLNAMQALEQQGQFFAGGLGAALVLVCLMISVYMVHMTHQRGPGDEHYKHILLVGCLLVAVFFMAKLSMAFIETLSQQGAFPDSVEAVYFGIPVAIGSMVVCLFLGLEAAMAFSLLAAVSVSILFRSRFDLFLFFYLNSTVAAYWIQHCRERKMFIQAGVKLGFFNLLVVTAISLYTGEISATRLLWDWSFSFLGGIGVGIITLGVAPLIEIGFGFTTDITLLELANLDQPILRKLMINAPGTYHHSVIVGSLVEAAATEIGANPLVGKVCGYYHDIGKINKPLYFIENQRDGKNRHDKLAPSMSSLILISHIKHGVEIATKNKLGKPIIDAIRQHHGTSLIRYFYEKAKQQRGEDAVKIDDFRYPGPKPQTREAGLVMLADVVEAASRTLENPTPARIQGLVQNLVNKIFSDGQLDDCELTLRDLHNIAKIFNKILTGIYHHRIEYSESPALGNGKTKNGSSDRQPTKQDPHPPDDNRKGGKSHLKRLGLS